MSKYLKIMKDISGLEKCLEKEGVSKEEIKETRELYMSNKTDTAYKTMEAYKTYMTTRYNNLKKYWGNRFNKW